MLVLSQGEVSLYLSRFYDFLHVAVHVNLAFCLILFLILFLPSSYHSPTPDIM